jgi:hypothetical protein
LHERQLALWHGSNEMRKRLHSPASPELPRRLNASLMPLRNPQFIVHRVGSVGAATRLRRCQRNDYIYYQHTEPD